MQHVVLAWDIAIQGAICAMCSALFIRMAELVLHEFVHVYFHSGDVSQLQMLEAERVQRVLSQ